MKKGYIILIAIAVVLLAVCGTCVGYRNGMVSADQNVKKAWGNVENQYQRRFDLIPNLVNTVKGYAQHESTTLQNVTDARAGLKTAYDNAKASLTSEVPENIKGFQQTQSELNRQLGLYINAVHEAYPDLKASENFKDLQEELAGTENRIAKARRDFNIAVEAFNNKILRFPGSLFAWGYSEKDMFSADPGADRAPKVDFGTDPSTAPDVDF